MNDALHPALVPLIEALARQAAEEYLDVLSRRRDDVLRLLENKGIRVAPDPIEIATANGEPA